MFLPDNSVYSPVENPNMACKRTANYRISMEERLNSYAEIDQTYTEDEALAEASRCLYCPTHWCQNACPAGVPVADFIKNIRERDYEGAYELISSRSSLSDICSRLCPQEKQCQSNCTRGICSEAVGIGKLERFVSDHHRKHAAANAPKSVGKRAAVIGSGPSGLAASKTLRAAGIDVTVYDRNEKAGGLLQYGIPNMKLEKGVLSEKISEIRSMGVEFKLGAKVDQVLADEIVSAYDAVVIAVGSETCRLPKIDHADKAKGIVYAVEYLSDNVRSGSEIISACGKHVIIVGGGDTGNDCVGMAVRNKCRSVLQVEMMPENPKKSFITYPFSNPAHDIRFDCSQEEYLNAYRQDPHKYTTVVEAVNTAEDGTITSAVLRNLRTGRVEEVPCDMLIIAAGFTGPKKDVFEAFKIHMTDGYQTSHEKIFCCGDCRTGQSLVVKAMVDGQKCAETILKSI